MCTVRCIAKRIGLPQLRQPKNIILLVIFVISSVMQCQPKDNQPFTPPSATPATMYLDRIRYAITSGMIVTNSPTYTTP